MKQSKGKVYLVGAGPGDIGLLTVKGMKCLQRAEVVIYDLHLNAQILNYINHDAEFIYAGKRGGHHAMTQNEINTALVRKALEGKIVCRLKGGDPFVFGRGGEEAEYLVQNGIEFEVVPGVSSAVAAPAYAGIPLTHRLYSSSFAVIPGYEDTTKEESAIDWTKLATGVGTLVILMAVKNLDMIVRKLMENGRRPETPVAVVRWGTRPDQKTIVSTLEEVINEVKDKEIKPPAVVVIGEVVKLRETLGWYEHKPLFGHRILVTREHAAGFEPLEDLGAEILEFSTIEIVPPTCYRELDAAIERISTYNWLIFTSGNGVRCFFERFFGLDKDIRDLKGIKICAIGTKTAAEIKRYGIKVDLMPEEFRAEGLIETFLKVVGQRSAQNSLWGMKFLLPRAEVAREIFPEMVRKLGGEIDVPAAYRAIKPELHGKRLKRFLQEGRITIATFTSAATFTNFIEIIGSDAYAFLKEIIIAVIGPVTAKAVEKAGLKVSIMPEQSTIEAMVDEIIQKAARTNQ
ncbi:MAG TPA: uroporphyrinogen-III C-methyltransferase [Nitrospiraceae bacterium]|jgi:uroporphyrinogen III methyltransferase/synthase|nr:uroporphyrinogen-III C-methyltransferase [Nitrospiraceae bacterium]